VGDDLLLGVVYLWMGGSGHRDDLLLSECTHLTLQTISDICLGEIEPFVDGFAMVAMLALELLLLEDFVSSLLPFFIHRCLLTCGTDFRFLEELPTQEGLMQ
jgi:hypothetical protein